MSDFISKAQQIWHAALMMRESARGFGDGNPDSIADAMLAHTPLPGDSEETQYRKAQQLLDELVNRFDTWPAFRNLFCERPRFIQEVRCQGNEYGEGQVVEYICAFGVRKLEEEDNCSLINP